MIQRELSSNIIIIIHNNINYYYYYYSTNHTYIHTYDTISSIDRNELINSPKCNTLTSSCSELK